MDLKDIRERIDRVDDGLLKLFLERMDLSEEVAAFKRENHLPVLNPEREREILYKVSRAAGDRELYAYQLFSTLMQLSRARQNELIAPSGNAAARIRAALEQAEDVFPRTGVVACQGVEGANAQAACEKILPRAHIVYMKTFQAVFDAVDSGLCQFGVLPIENSANGSVRAVYELLLGKDVSIVRSTRLFIRHALLARPGTRKADIREVYSHEQALGQCSRFLSSLENVKAVPCANTAAAAQMIARSSRMDAAAIASPACAELYGLETLESDVQDNGNNYTRFICIAKKPVIYAGANRISLNLACRNKPGALYQLLALPTARGINMSKLESCPVSGRDFEFMFFIDLEASVREPGVTAMLDEMERASAGFQFLGNYQEV